MKLTVTEADVRGARRCEASNCPVARAFKRVTGKTCAVFPDAGEWKVMLLEAERLMYYTLSREQADMIRLFDETGTFMTGELHLKLVGAEVPCFLQSFNDAAKPAVR